MLDQVLDIFGITSDIDLDIMKANQTLTGITTKALEGLDLAIKEHRPKLFWFMETQPQLLQLALQNFTTK